MVDPTAISVRLICYLGGCRSEVLLEPAYTLSPTCICTTNEKSVSESVSEVLSGPAMSESLSKFFVPESTYKNI